LFFVLQNNFTDLDEVVECHHIVCLDLGFSENSSVLDDTVHDICWDGCFGGFLFHFSFLLHIEHLLEALDLWELVDFLFVHVSHEFNHCEAVLCLEEVRSSVVLDVYELSQLCLPGGESHRLNPAPLLKLSLDLLFEDFDALLFLDFLERFKISCCLALDKVELHLLLLVV